MLFMRNFETRGLNLELEIEVLETGNGRRKLKVTKGGTAKL